MKLDIEEAILRLNQNPDFFAIHRKFDAAAPLVTNFRLYLIKTDKLKSGFYYLASYLQRLTHCKILTIRDRCYNKPVDINIATNFKKGFWKLRTQTKEGCKIQKLILKDVQFEEKSTNIANVMEELYNSLTGLISLEFNNTNLLRMKKYKIGKAIIENKPELLELRVKHNSCTSGNVAVSIADGLMECRKLEFFSFVDNNSLCMEGSVCQVMSNLPWSPNLKVVDFSKSRIKVS